MGGFSSRRIAVLLFASPQTHYVVENQKGNVRVSLSSHVKSCYCERGIKGKLLLGRIPARP